MTLIQRPTTNSTPTTTPTSTPTTAPTTATNPPAATNATAPQATGVGSVDAGAPKATPSGVAAHAEIGLSGLHHQIAGASSVATTAKVKLDPAERQEIATKHATCPFMGAAVATGALAVRNDKDNPLASKEDVRALGNSGGGDLGDLLVGFAEGNHTKMLGKSGKLDNGNVPHGVFSLIFGGSQGAHDGNSRILKPAGRGEPGVGVTDEKRFDEFTAAAKGGYMTRSQIAEQIAKNLMADPNAKVAGFETASLLLHDTATLVKESGESIVARLRGKHTPNDHRELLQAVTKLAGEDNLVGSAGEFGLLAAFLANSPNTKSVNGEPAYAVADLKTMFVDKQFPQGWESWPKKTSDWVTSTTALTAHAARSYLLMKIGVQ